MKRDITINTSDDYGQNKSFKLLHANPQATDANMYQAIQDIMSLSENTFVSATVTDSYTLEVTEQPQQANKPTSTPTSFRRI